MSRIDIDKLTSVIKQQIKDYKEDNHFENTGVVLTVGDGICTCYGLDSAMMGEKVIFKKNNTEGLVFNLEENTVGIIVLGNSDTIEENDIVQSTGEIFEVPVGENLLGRVIDPLGNPLDGLGAIVAKEKRPIERKAYGVIQRGPVNEPLQTGIMVIDALIPIGRGQRELIIGDRQTGKTSIAIDTILNQKDKNVKCVYVAIGQKESSVAAITNILNSNGALSYTTIVSASASKNGSMQYLAPFAGVSIAEYFMEKGEDCLIIYDDLSKHAVAYRELSLLLKRPPGREAYPGDVFYLHSRLLERAAKLSKELGGGSITALPIIETKEGDISAYIPTNVISITDGQIFLESKLFYSGIRPAVNAGLSVSRVGGAAQISAIKKVAGLLRINLAAYRELEAFTQFGSDLDQNSQKRLERGKKTVELLKQNVHELQPVELQTVLLFALNQGLLDDLTVEQIKPFSNTIIQRLDTVKDGKELKDAITETRKLPDKDKLTAFIKDCKRFI